MKKIIKYTVCFFVITSVAYFSEYIRYLLNKNFILTNINALPFKYQLMLGCGRWAWWSFLISGVIGLLVTLYLLYLLEKEVTEY